MGSRKCSGCTLDLQNDVAALLQEGHNLLENDLPSMCKAQVPLENGWAKGQRLSGTVLPLYGDVVEFGSDWLELEFLLLQVRSR